MMHIFKTKQLVSEGAGMRTLIYISTNRLLFAKLKERYEKI